MNDAVLAINIFDNDILINKDNVPVLFYWNRTDDVILSLQNSDDFKHFIKNKISHYDNSYISFIYYELDDNNDETEEKHITYKHQNIQDIFSLDILDKFWINLVFDYFLDLYKLSYKEDFKFVEKSDKQITEIYNKIKNKYKKKINVETITNYINSKLKEDFKLNENNLIYINKKLYEILDYANI